MASATYFAHFGNRELTLPVLPLNSEHALALLITVDLEIDMLGEAGRQLADSLREVHADVVVTIATMGIPLALLVSKALGHEHVAVLHETPKIDLDGALQEPVHSITTAGQQRLLLDPSRVKLLESKRVVIIDDVISTGASVKATLDLVRRSRDNAVASHARK